MRRPEGGLPIRSDKETFRVADRQMEVIVANRGDISHRAFRDDFIRREHEALQEKMSRSAADIWRVETIVPLAIATLYAWLAKDSGHIGPIFGWLLWVPVGLVLFGACRQEIRYRYMDVVEDYLIQLERTVYGTRSSLVGWENHWKLKGSHGNRHARRVFWGIVLVATVLIAVHGDRLYLPQARLGGDEPHTPCLIARPSAEGSRR